MIEKKELPFLDEITKGMLFIKYNSGLYETLYNNNEYNKQRRNSYMQRQQRIFQNSSGKNRKVKNN